MIIKLKVSDLVKWYDYYNDEVVRDAGLGVVLDVRRMAHVSCTSYLVYKFKTATAMWFDEFNLDEINAPVTGS